MSEPIFDLTAHQKMWLWISELEEWPSVCGVNGDLKKLWIGQNGYFGLRLKSECFACQYDVAKRDDIGPDETGELIDECEGCPLIWPGSAGVCWRSYELYGRWLNTSFNDENFSLLALEIACLDVREGVKTK